MQATHMDTFPDMSCPPHRLCHGGVVPDTHGLRRRHALLSQNNTSHAHSTVRGVENRRLRMEHFQAKDRDARRWTDVATVIFYPSLAASRIIAGLILNSQSVATLALHIACA